MRIEVIRCEENFFEFYFEGEDYIFVNLFIEIFYENEYVIFVGYIIEYLIMMVRKLCFKVVIDGKIMFEKVFEEVV